MVDGVVGIISNQSLLFFVVLSLGALGGYFSERVGIVNISINGQMIFGALVFTIFAEIFQPLLGNMSFAIPMLLSMVFTLLASSLFGLLTIKLKANQTVAGTAINLLAAGLATFTTQPLGPILSHGQHPKLTSNYLSLHEFGNSGFFLTTLMLFVVIGLVIFGLWLMMRFTPFGLRLRAIGNNPNAVDAQGINVTRYQWIAISISGLLSGLAGAIFMYQQPGFFEGNVSGFGFLALAILIAGSWRIPLIFVVSIVFAVITKIFVNINIISAASASVDVSKRINIPSDIGRLIPYAITFVGMIVFSKYNAAPKNIGIPFDKARR